jgi:hypothetical protein
MTTMNVCCLCVYVMLFLLCNSIYVLTQVTAIIFGAVPSKEQDITLFTFLTKRETR